MGVREPYELDGGRGFMDAIGEIEMTKALQKPDSAAGAMLFTRYASYPTTSTKPKCNSLKRAYLK